MKSANVLQMKLATILSATDFGLHDVRNLIELTQYITKDEDSRFHQLVSERMRDELNILLDDDGLDSALILATALGNAAVLDWLNGNSQSLAHLVVDSPDTLARHVALEALEICYFIAEHRARSTNCEQRDSINATAQSE